MQNVQVLLHPTEIETHPAYALSRLVGRVDGKVSKVTGAAGNVYDPGKVLTFTAKNSVEVRTGKSSATYFTLNGEDLGRMSKQSNPETWLFAPPDPPVKTSRR